MNPNDPWVKGFVQILFYLFILQLHCGFHPLFSSKALPSNSSLFPTPIHLSSISIQKRAGFLDILTKDSLSICNKTKHVT